MRSAVSLLFIALIAMPLASAQTSGSTDPRLNWFCEARFGMFIHWGLYSVPAGQWGRKTTYHEWFQLQTGMANTNYEKFAAEFNPTRFDARQWVKTAKDAGMKYIVITAKHHEGFSMFDTAYSDFNIVKATPFKRDPMKELAEACREAGIKLCFFYALPDWHHPELPAKYNQRGFHGGPKPDADVSKYAEFTRNQVRELLTKYGPVGIMWFDGGAAFAGANRAEVLEADRMVAMIRELQPDCLINNRLGAGGDYGTPERVIPARALSRDFEVCMTLNDNWGYNRADQNWKSAKTVVRNLADIASKGGNLLLNVGPTAEGVFPDSANQILAEVGEWMKRNGESIYGTKAGPFLGLSWGSCTLKSDSSGTRVYLHVFDWPASGVLQLPGLKSRVESVRLLSQQGRGTEGNEGNKGRTGNSSSSLTSFPSVQFSNAPDGLVITLPDVDPDPIASTFVVQIKGAVEVEPEPLRQEPDGSVQLPAVAAIFHGTEIQYQQGPLTKSIGYWRNPDDWVEWTFNVTKPGKFIISAEVASKEGAALDVGIGDRKITVPISATGDYYRFQIVELGSIEISASGKTSLSLRPVKEGWKPVNVRRVELKPSATLSANGL